MSLTRLRSAVPDVLEEETLVWDTSSLSHAFEEFSHASMSAYMEMNPPKTWSRLKKRLMRRIGSESLSRRLLLACDRLRCLFTSGAYRELKADPHYSDSLDILLGNARRVEEKYVRRKSKRGEPRGFSSVFKPRLVLSSPPKEYVDYVMAVAESGGWRISRADAEGVALAMVENAVLVTADRRQAEVAEKLGVRTIYTI